MTWLEFKHKVGETTSGLISDAVPITFLLGETEIHPTDIAVGCDITGDKLTVIIDLKEGGALKNDYTNETIVDIIKDLRSTRARFSDRDAGALAYRLEAAMKREQGNAAKMREALKLALSLLDLDKGCSYKTISQKDIDSIKAALAAPPRNCDMTLVADGPADNNADKAWLAFKHHNPDAYFDVPGLLRCIDWLLAPATEKEGGGDVYI